MLKAKLIAAILFACFALTSLILATDVNLQTNFGSVKPFFIHWYGLLVTGIIDLVGGVLFLRAARPPYLIATIWFVFMPVFMVADTLTYAEVYFKTPAQFAVYLFGITKYPGTLYYIPGAFDALFALYLAGFAACLLAPSK